MITCPSNSSAAVLEFSTTAAQYGDTAEQMLGKLLAVGLGEHTSTAAPYTIVNADPPQAVAEPRAGRSSLTFTAPAANTSPVFLFLSAFNTDTPAAGDGHPLVPGGSITLSRVIHGDIATMTVLASSTSGDQTLIKTDW